jgi:hypothetical protein
MMMSMNLSTLTSSELKQLSKLLARKEALQARINKIDEQLNAIGGGKTVAAKPGKTRGRKPRSGKQMKLKDAITSLLQGAGKDGLTVKQIADSLNVAHNRVYTWFYATGRKIKEIKKVGSAQYAWKE